MSWQPSDLVSDKDLEAYERSILTQFNTDDWQFRRQKALEDWLFPLLEGRGFDPARFRTRFEPTSVLGLTSSTVTDRTAVAATAEGLNLATILAAPTDALYIGSPQQFRGLSVRVTDHPNATSAVLGVTLWCDTWTGAEVQDSTLQGNKPFSRGGSILWRMPEDVVLRVISTSASLYWAKLTLTVAPAGCLVGPVLVIRRSRLCAAATLRTLALIFREAPISQDGPWRDKAEWYEREAERAWLRVADRIGGEFDTDASDAIGSVEAAHTADAVNGGGWSLQRG